MSAITPLCLRLQRCWPTGVLMSSRSSTPSGGTPPGAWRRVGPSTSRGKSTPSWNTANRGKRSLGLDLQTEEGISILHRLIAISDVFLTNKPPNVRERLHITEEEVRPHNENIVYAAGTAWGTKGPEGNRGGYDMTSFWVRSGAAHGHLVHRR